MIDETLALTTLRPRYLSVTIATTGSTSLSATAAGYARAAGSFVAEGFAVGMEVTASGFATAANNGKGVITGVSALTMTVAKKALGTSADGKPTVIAGAANVIEAADVGRTVAALVPMLRAFDNTEVVPAAGVPYIGDQLSPAGGYLITFPANQGHAQDEGLYFVTWYGLSGKGTAAILRSTGAVLARFTPATTITMSDGNVIRVRGENRSEPKPQGGQIVPIDGGWSYRLLQIPYRVRSRNTIAA